MYPIQRFKVRKKQDLLVGLIHIFHLQPLFILIKKNICYSIFSVSTTLKCNFTDSSLALACAACSASAFTTALIVFDSLPRSSSRCATKFGFLPILFSLKGESD